ncbi:MAG TPA: hypothetical protein VF438_00740 [Candidatus Paceibacterota bacterium]
MYPTYSLVSPSLEGVLKHDSLSYEGIKRPLEVIRAFEGPGAKRGSDRRTHEGKVLEQYFYDLYGVFMKKFSAYVLDTQVTDGESLKLQALL